MKKYAIHNTRKLDRDFDGFDDPLVKILLGIGIVSTAIFFIAAFLMSLVGLQFLGFFKLATWLLGAFSIFGAICGLVSGMRWKRWKTGAASRRASARF